MAEASSAPEHPGLSAVVAISKAAGDPLRADILRLLERDSFSVLELCHITHTGQPALSHHLKILLTAGLVAQRREGNSIFYRRALTECAPLGPYVEALFAALDAQSLTDDLSGRVAEIHERRSERSREFFTANVERFAAQQALIAEPAVYDEAAIAMLSTRRRRCALEVGPGEGSLLPRLAERFDHVVAIDESTAMLEKAQSQIHPLELGNVSFRRCALAEVRTDRPFDVIIAGMVVHHNPSPRDFFRDAAAVLDRDGVLLIVELCPHDQEWVRDACGDIWLGFDETALDGWARAAGLHFDHAQYLAQKNGFRIQLRRYSKEQT